jgi:hypothetical protein
MDTYTEALKWAGQGIAVIPIWPCDKKPALKTWEEFRTRLPTNDELLRWFRPYHSNNGGRNLGIITGWQNLVVVDFDNLEIYFTWRQLYPIQTYQVLTGRGVHAYFKIPGQVKSRKLYGVDIKASGGYVLAPPSIHPSRSVYQVLEDAPIMQVTSINDVMPESFFEQDNQIELVSTQYKGVLPATPAIGDPWDTADRAGVDLLQEAKKVPILTFFPNAQKSSGDGRWYKVQCPFHQDQNPSMWIDTRRGLCGCYRGCTPKPFDVVNLYSHLVGVSNQEAIFALSKMI